MPTEDKDSQKVPDEPDLSKTKGGDSLPKLEKSNYKKIKNFEWNRFVVVTILTMIISGVWVGGFVMRMFFHWTIASAPTLDAAMLLILGYWFSTAATKDKDD